MKKVHHKFEDNLTAPITVGNNPQTRVLSCGSEYREGCPKYFTEQYRRQFSRFLPLPYCLTTCTVSNRSEVRVPDQGEVEQGLFEGGIEK